MSLIDKFTEWLLAREQPKILELGSHRFLMATGSFIRNTPVLQQFKSIEAPQGCVLANQLDQFVFDADEAKRLLRELFNVGKLEEKFVSIILPDQAFLFGSLIAPVASAKVGLQVHLEKEIQKASTLPFKDYIVRYEFGKKTGNKTPVHYCALPRGIMNDLLLLCDEAGLVPMSVQPSFVGLIKLLRLSQGETKHPSVLVHFGNETVTAGVFSSDGLRHAQLINIGVTDFVKCLETNLAISRNEARSMLSRDLILLEDPTAEVQLEIDTYRLLEPVFADLLQKLYGFLLLYTNDHPEEAGFIKIVLSGGGAKIKNIDRLLTANLGVETILISREVSASTENVSIPEGESIESLAPLLGNMLLEPWRTDRHERVMSA